jgi:antagonist of KipI
MPVIVVESPGLLTTVQDLGRPGYGHLGVAPAGAADPVALRVGNALVGNPPDAAALEMTLAGGRFLLPEGAAVALTGADGGPVLSGQPAPMWATVEVRPGERLAVGAARAGARCYLSVRGGIRVPLFLGSASTQLACGLGGFCGRRLQRGDVLEIGAAEGGYECRRLSARALGHFAPANTLRVTAGPEWERFDAGAREAFLAQAWRVTADSDRAGLRLAGARLETSGFERMITEGVDLGSIQVPPSGQPIILFVEQQTTGGYPRIGVVASVDLWRVGQLRPGDEVRFSLVDLEEAVRLIREQEQLLASEEFLFGE